jgi:DNA gyrase subunit A
LIVAESGDPILTATEKGYGKRTQLDEYRSQARGGSGVISIKTSDRNGEVVGAIQVTDEDEMMLISNKGTLVRARAVDVSIIGRNTQGVTLINIADDEKLVSVAKIAETDDEEEGENQLEVDGAPLIEDGNQEDNDTSPLASDDTQEDE